MVLPQRTECSGHFIESQTSTSFMKSFAAPSALQHAGLPQAKVGHCSPVLPRLRDTYRRLMM
jgi:hypothetical protein